jgi:hypothetical protein
MEEFKNKINLKLVTRKRLLIDSIRSEYMKKIAMIDEEILKLPYVCFLAGLKRKYGGKTIHIKHLGKSEPCKRPSVILQIQDLSYVFDGSDLLIDGKKIDIRKNAFLKDVQTVLKRHMK